MTKYQWAAPEAVPYSTPVLIDSTLTIPGVWLYREAMEVEEAEPGTIKPYAPPEPPTPVVPESVTLWQAREALRRAGLLAAVDAHIESLGVTDEVYNAWHYKDQVRRNSPLVAALAPQFNLSKQQLDQLFITAGGLE